LISAKALGFVGLLSLSFAVGLGFALPLAGFGLSFAIAGIYLV
jgi:hypothetical protein